MIGCVMSCSEVIGLVPVLTEAATVKVYDERVYHDRMCHVM